MNGTDRNGFLDLSIIIVSHNVKKYLLECIASIKENCRKFAYEIIVIDNNSMDGSADEVECLHRDVTLIRNATNEGFAKANNRGYEKTSGEFILLLNPDTLVKPGAVEEVLSFMRGEPSAGLCTCRIVGEDGAPQKIIHAFSGVMRNIAGAFFIDRILFPELRNKYYYGATPFKVDYVGGAFMLIRRRAIGSGSILNPDYFMYSEEKDLSLRLRRAGWCTWFVPSAEILHYGGKSTALVPLVMFLELQKSQVKFYLKYYSRVYAMALCISWWMILCSQFIASIPLMYLKKSRNRIRLFWPAILLFPAYMVCSLKQKTAVQLPSEGMN